MADIRRVIAFVAAAGITCFVAWAGGLEFTERGEPLAMAICVALCFGGLAASYPFQESRR